MGSINRCRSSTYLSEEQISSAARTISDLMHFEADAGDACVLWGVAIRHAVVTRVFDVLRGVDLLDLDRRRLWVDGLATDEYSELADFTESNG